MKKIFIYKKVQRRAFSLIELSVVMVVIGFLIVGITAGSVMIETSNLASSRALTMQSPVSTIPNLVVWYESSTKESFVAGQNIDGQQLTTWYNREPSGFLTKNNLTTIATSTYNKAGINNIPVVNMDVAGNMALANFSGSAPTTSTVIIVFKPTESITNDIFYTIADAGVLANPTSSISIANNRVCLDTSSITLIPSTPVCSSTTTNPAAFVTNGTYILVVYFDGASSKVFVNNITEVGGSGATLSLGANPLNGLTIGSNKSGASGIAAEISEVIVYGRVLKDTERQDVMSYLSKKYKIAVTGL